MFCKVNILSIIAVAAIAFPAIVTAQAKGGFGGSWEWRSPANRQKESTMFALDIKQSNGKISGQMWFGMLVDGENDGSDASTIPFVGTIAGNRATIEFDPNDIHSIDDEHVRYKRPRSPTKAILELKGKKLHWTETKGSLDSIGLGPLRSFLLSRYK